ncbi:MAG: hypothetical protein IIB31_05745 [Chloroflexi bacterium]|nr:hypothetical protein [Chloroflexota bacterium]MCH8897097.1 hypothetical protein [Chloroflexota bacterium]
MIEANPQIPPPSAQAAREVRRNSPLRQARTCYDHLAGVAGVAVMDAMLKQGWLVPAGEPSGPVKGRTHYRLTAQGGKALQSLGVDLFPQNGSKRMYAYGCVDWTERRFHLGGGLAAAILLAMIEDGTLRRDPGSRVATMLKPVSGWKDRAAR